MPSPTDRFYTQTHEWLKLQGDTVLLGITRFAVDELTDVTFVELPAVGKLLASGKAFGEIESVKATSELYSPVDGAVVKINDAVKNDPSTINTDPYEAGWLVAVKAGPVDTSAFMSAAQYDAKFNIH
ncbi:MAG: glycine cleavage system protein GcvH [Phycisphaerae bacterium]|nr:glycine cleavage system protein GcvH [Phycisphaerae bacterium]